MLLGIRKIWSSLDSLLNKTLNSKFRLFQADFVLLLQQVFSDSLKHRRGEVMNFSLSSDCEWTFPGCKPNIRTPPSAREGWLTKFNPYIYPQTHTHIHILGFLREGSSKRPAHSLLVERDHNGRHQQLVPTAFAGLPSPCCSCQSLPSQPDN